MSVVVPEVVIHTVAPIWLVVTESFGIETTLSGCLVILSAEVVTLHKMCWAAEEELR